jgi:subtilase family serine protease
MSGITVTVHLPLRNSDALDALIARQGDSTSSDYHKFITPDQFRAQYGPAAKDLAAASAQLHAMGFQTQITSQSVIAAAPQAIVEKAFGVKLHPAQAIGHIGHLAQSAAASIAAVPNVAPTLPTSLQALNATVAFAHAAHHLDSRKVQSTLALDNRYSQEGPYWFDDLKQAYGYPAYDVARGTGRTIAIVIDSDILDSDLALYFGHEKLAPPTVIRRPVDGGPRPASITDDSTFEASLDVQQSFGSAPGAQIMLYGIPILDDQPITDAYQAIVDDNKADVVNSSFGECELYYTKAYNNGVDYKYLLKAEHDVYRQGNAQGITFVASSGDSGAYECTNPAGTTFIKGVSTPATDADVTAVGGTNLVTVSKTTNLTSAYQSEEAYFDMIAGGVPNEIWGSGGGISTQVAKPPYQQLVQTGATMRTTPDVSLHMGGCPEGSALPCNPEDSADIVALVGGFYGVIGTSASSPDFAGVLAVTESNLGTRLGNANYYIYALAAIAPNKYYRQNIPGNNGYAATSGYNYVLGNGTVKVDAFAQLAGSQKAGIPQTATNP